jgi:AbiV family abortive infection protein
MKALSIEQIELARKKVFENTEELISEAQLLFDNGRYARAFAVAHLASEEIAKLMMLARIGTDLLLGRTIDWRKFFRRFRNHEEKLQNMALFDYFFLSDPDLLANRDLRKLEADEAAVPDQNRRKNLSLYVDLADEPFRRPSEIINENETFNLLELVKERFRFCSAIETGSQGRLSELVKSPGFKQLADLIDKLYRDSKRRTNDDD